MLDQGRLITEAVSIPVIGDGDNGYANAMNVKITFKEFIKAGFAGILLEDQNEHKYYKRKEMSVEDLVVHLRIEEDNKVAEKNTYAPDSAKVNDNMDMIAMVSDVISMISEVNLVGSNKRGWWVDTGATRYVCADKSMFHSFRAVDNGDKLYMGNSVTANIKGEGEVIFKMTSGKELKLTNVLYVLEIRKNLRPRKQDDNDLQDERQDQREEEEVKPRRSKKARTKKSFGPDFVSFMVENEPMSYQEAIFKKKMKADGTIDKYKERLVIKAFRQREGLDYFDTYSPVTFRLTAATGHFITKNMVITLEYVGLAPKGSQRVQSFLKKAAKGLVGGGK
uniref:Uncharacterized protein n=1 Tax=Tanacetum cinerariifolium TaxID=118510 RepID=A0A6L2MK25_TANCI|nr:hypothetical protein T459_22274 [Tanacetum cinerariifolium]